MKHQIYPSFRWGFLAVLLINGFARGEEDPGARLRQLAAAPRFRLATTAPTAADDFSFVMGVRKKGLEPTLIYFRGEGHDAQLLACSAAGRPYLYAGRGQMLILDQKYPGRLLLFSGVAFEAQIADAPTGMSLVVRFRPQGTEPRSRLTWNPGALVRQISAVAVDVSGDPAARTLWVKAPDSQMRIQPAAGKDPRFPVESLSISLPDSALSFDTIDIPPAREMAIPVLTADAVNKLGAPVTQAVYSGGQVDDQALFLAAGFWSDPKNVHAAEQLEKILPGVPVVARCLESQSLATLEATHAIADDLSPTEVQRTSIEDLFRHRAEDVGRHAAALRWGQSDEPATFHALARDADCSAPLRKILTREQYVLFARRYLSTALPDDSEDPMRAVLATILDAAGKLDLSAEQRDRLGDLVVGLRGRSEAVRQQVLAGELDAAGIQRASTELSKNLVTGLHDILTPDQYQRLQSEIIGPHQPPTPGRHVERS